MPDPDAIAALRAAREFIQEHDAGDHSDATWPCDGRCAQARALRDLAALTPPTPAPTVRECYHTPEYGYDPEDRDA